LIEVALEAQVTLGDDTHQALVTDDRQTRNPALLGERDNIPDQRVGRNRDRVLDDATLVFFHAGDLCRLLLDRQVLVHDPEAAFLCDCNRQSRLGNRVHGGRNQRNIELDFARQASPQLRLVRKNFRFCRHQQYIVESEGFLADTHGYSGRSVAKRDYKLMRARA
jgi:hypothetical protein